MKNSLSWRVLQFVGNVILMFWIITFASGNLWVLVPIIAISLWNYIDGLLQPSDDIVIWPFLHIVGNVILMFWIITFASGNLWVLVPVLAICLWNYIDGKVRK